MTTPSSGTEGELSLTISPYAYIEWRGPRAKLETLDVVPAHIKWPERINYVHWQADSFEYTLRRCRPDGLHGPMRRFMKCDFWYVRATAHSGTAQVLTMPNAHLEFGALLARAVRSGEAIWIHFSRLCPNERIEKLKARLVPDGAQT